MNYAMRRKLSAKPRIDWRRFLEFQIEQIKEEYPFDDEAAEEEVVAAESQTVAAVSMDKELRKSLVKMAER